jgi:DNA-binding MarR family transcriptional regulator
MNRTVHELDYDGNGASPLVGALLRRPFLAVRARIVAALHEAGFNDLLPAHVAIFQYPGPHGRSPSDIARSTLASKQATNNLLTQLERSGYLIRAVKPNNRRERTITLTDRGRQAVATIRDTVSVIEEEWKASLGTKRYEQLRSGLEALDAVLAAPY